MSTSISKGIASCAHGNRTSPLIVSCCPRPSLRKTHREGRRRALNTRSAGCPYRHISLRCVCRLRPNCLDCKNKSKSCRLPRVLLLLLERMGKVQFPVEDAAFCTFGNFGRLAETSRCPVPAGTREQGMQCFLDNYLDARKQNPGRQRMGKPVPADLPWEKTLPVVCTAGSLG